jgi:divalent metal cation (Fe/Co/Zn/Cd) transporter
MVEKGLLIETVSILWLVIEAGVSLGSGLAAHSLALTAFGLDSIIELLAAFVLFWRLLMEFKRERAEKVERAERLSSWFVGVALLLLAVYILISSVTNLITRSGAEESLLGIIIAACAGIVMPIMGVSKRKIGRKIGSAALVADGACSMVCAVMSWLLLAGVVLTALTKLWWIDSVISLAFVLFVVKEGLEAIGEAREHAV